MVPIVTGAGAQTDSLDAQQHNLKSSSAQVLHRTHPGLVCPEFMLDMLNRTHLSLSRQISRLWYENSQSLKYL